MRTRATTKKEKEWAIVLAAGDGTRLSVLTDTDGSPVPKQFWSLRGSRSLLGDALHRAYQLVPRRRTVVVVAEKHRPLWEDELSDLPPENVIVQPANRGTAAGLLLPALSILRRDPGARLLVLPSDHFVDKEHVLHESLRLALDSLGRDRDRIVLLGISPATPETGYGWIVPRPGGGGLDRVAAFVEKPAAPNAAVLMERGALWNSFLIAMRGQVLVDLFVERHPELIVGMRAALEATEEAALAELYDGLGRTDFSREILQGSEERLSLLRVPECGWTDLGTPDRVAECVDRLGNTTRLLRTAERPSAHLRFSLAAALCRLGTTAEPAGLNVT